MHRKGASKMKRNARNDIDTTADPTSSMIMEPLKRERPVRTKSEVVKEPAVSSSKRKSGDRGGSNAAVQHINSRERHLGSNKRVKSDERKGPYGSGDADKKSACEGSKTRRRRGGEQLSSSIEDILAVIERSSNIIVVAGAGISTSCGQVGCFFYPAL
jgi:hypothetical protein